MRLKIAVFLLLVAVFYSKWYCADAQGTSYSDEYNGEESDGYSDDYNDGAYDSYDDTSSKLIFYFKSRYETLFQETSFITQKYIH